MSYTFVIVAQGDTPVYDADFQQPPKKDAQDTAHLNQFIIHAALDMVDDAVWTTNSVYLKTVDKFNELSISAYVTAGRARFMMLHDVRNEDGIKNFFHEVHELYVKIILNPFYSPQTPIKSEAFDTRVRALAKKHLN